MNGLLMFLGGKMNELLISLSEILTFLGFPIGIILAVVLSAVLADHHITRIIGAIIGAAHYYFVHRLQMEVGIRFVDGMLFTFSLFDLTALLFAIMEVFCIITLVVTAVISLFGGDISIDAPSPGMSHVMGGLANLIATFFR